MALSVDLKCLETGPLSLARFNNGGLPVGEGLLLTTVIGTIASSSVLMPYLATQLLAQSA